MKTAGQILKDARLAQKLDLKDIAKTTKINLEYLSFIEADTYQYLPNSAVARGFIRNYSEYLHLKPEHILAVFRRDFIEDLSGQIIPRGFTTPVSPRFVWTPKITLLVGITTVIISFFVYLFYQYRLLSGPPTLIIAEPANQTVTTENIITISGQTNPEASLSINNTRVTLSGGGKFSFRWELPQKGEHTITLVATSKSGKITSVSRTVTYY